VQTPQHVKVAVLLATYNGAPFIEPQIRSLKENVTPITLHWLDDHSTDDTRAAVRSAALSSGVDLCEWHASQHQGVPGAFFRLLECVEADIYLFCDQDDIWQPGKIDATVANLVPDLASPTLCFSEPLTFRHNEPGIFVRLSDVLAEAKAPRGLQESRLFMSSCCCGHTVGFTRPLREIYLNHKDIARAYAIMHDQWMYILAVSSGTFRMLSNVPTTLYRLHGKNFITVYITPTGNRIVWKWRLQRALRRAISRQAHGFILASTTLPAGSKLERLVALARVVSALDRRQSPAALFRLARRGATSPSRYGALWFAASCLWSDARS
jgi:glycosyltransferase involved in cell wall biosynthesis